jgi:hypothetical protein
VLPLLTLFALVGCYADEQDDPGLYEFRTTWSCGTCGGTGNSPRVNDFPIPELHNDHYPNAAGVRLDRIRDLTGKFHEVRVVDDEFVAFDLGVPVGVGGDLVGWTIELRDSGNKLIELVISAYDDDVASLSDHGAPISAYGLDYEADEHPGEMTSVCPQVDPNLAVVTLILGETYDRKAKTVQPLQTLWFTLACADEAVFKMKRMNYGPNDDYEKGQPATVAQRQATLKMITADYCGTGQSFTAQGTPVVWIDRDDNVGPEEPPPGALVEAQWTAEGARCLEPPRHVTAADVAAVCALPACSQLSPTDPVVEWQTFVP